MSGYCKSTSSEHEEPRKGQSWRSAGAPCWSTAPRPGSWSLLIANCCGTACCAVWPAGSSSRSRSRSPTAGRSRFAASPFSMGSASLACSPAYGWSSLTAAELAVAEQVAQGLTNREAAAHLYLSPHTIDFHLRQVFRKLDVRSRVELTRATLRRQAEPAR